MAIRRPRPCSQPGFTEPAPLDAAGAPYRTFAPLPVPAKPAIGGVFQALSSRSPALALPSKPGHRGARFPAPTTEALSSGRLRSPRYFQPP